MLYRPKSMDYGIDGELEIFDANSDTTGLIAQVQVKATDKGGAPGRRL